MARDARIGAIGAEPIRQLYWEGKTEEANQRAKELLKANTTGIALGVGAASSSLLTDLLITAGTTGLDTVAEGNYKNFGKDLAKNAVMDLFGHGLVKGFTALDNFPIIKRMKTTFTGVPANESTLGEAMYQRTPTYTGTIWSTPNQGYAEAFARDGKVWKVLVDPNEINMLEAPKPMDGTYFPWTNLPFTRIDGQFKMLPTNKVYGSNSFTFSNPKASLLYNNPNLAKGNELEGIDKFRIQAHGGIDTSKFNNPLKAKREGLIQTVVTDDIVDASRKEGFSGVNFYGIQDGPSMYRGRYVDVPIDEAVYNPHTPHWILPTNKSKWSLLFKDLNKLKIKKHGGKLTK